MLPTLARARPRSPQPPSPAVPHARVGWRPARRRGHGRRGGLSELWRPQPARSPSSGWSGSAPPRPWARGWRPPGPAPWSSSASSPPGWSATGRPSRRPCATRGAPARSKGTSPSSSWPHGPPTDAPARASSRARAGCFRAAVRRPVLECKHLPIVGTSGDAALSPASSASSLGTPALAGTRWRTTDSAQSAAPWPAGRQDPTITRSRLTCGWPPAPLPADSARLTTLDPGSTAQSRARRGARDLRRGGAGGGCPRSRVRHGTDTSTPLVGRSADGLGGMVFPAELLPAPAPAGGSPGAGWAP
jgi:hypothetical protein